MQWIPQPYQLKTVNLLSHTVAEGQDSENGLDELFRLRIYHEAVVKMS